MAGTCVGQGKEQVPGYTKNYSSYYQCNGKSGFESGELCLVLTVIDLFCIGSSQ